MPAKSKLMRIYELNVNSEGAELMEIPHWDFEGQEAHGMKWGLVDFRIERMPIPQDEKKRLINAFMTTGFVAPVGNNTMYIFMSSGAKGQPELAEATPEQVESLPHLPDGWQTHIRDV